VKKSWQGLEHRFKKGLALGDPQYYGIIPLSVFLAAGAVIGAVYGVLTKSIKAVGQGSGK